MELHELLDIGGVDRIVLTKDAIRDDRTGGLRTCYRVETLDDNADVISGATCTSFENASEYVIKRTIERIDDAERERAYMIAGIQDARKDSGV